MSELSLEQLTGLLAKVNKLAAISAERDAASKAHDDANKKWNKSRHEYAQLHAEIVRDYGEEHAPLWIESIHGPRVTAA